MAHTSHSLHEFFRALDYALERFERTQSLSPVGPMALRVECHADDQCAVGEHKHQCGDCGTTWKHDDVVALATTHEDFWTAHSCPKCGTRETMKMEN